MSNLGFISMHDQKQERKPRHRTRPRSSESTPEITTPPSTTLDGNALIRAFQESHTTAVQSMMDVNSRVYALEKVVDQLSKTMNAILRKDVSVRIAPDENSHDVALSVELPVTSPVASPTAPLTTSPVSPTEVVVTPPKLVPPPIVSPPSPPTIDALLPLALPPAISPINLDAKYRGELETQQSESQHSMSEPMMMFQEMKEKIKHRKEKYDAEAV